MSRPWGLAMMLAACAGLTPLPSAAAEAQRPGERRLYLIGQDLDAIRGYIASGCCARPDGATAYLTFYKLLDPSANFGGLGVDAALKPVASEQGWGAGPVSAWKTAQEAGGDYLAIGLDLTGEPKPGALRQIAKGRYDAEIDHLAKFLRATGKIALLRIGYEFEGAWNKPYADHAAYVAAWRHIVTRMRTAGAERVQFVWQGSASPVDDVIDGRRDDIVRWYPGDSYVDWVGISWFLPPDDRVKGKAAVPTQRTLADELLKFARARRKPVMVAELSPQGFDLAARTRRNISPIWDGPAGQGTRALDDAGIWAGWYAPFLAYLRANDDVIRAVAYINVRWDAQQMWGAPYANGYWGDSRLEANRAIADRWSQAIEAWRGGTAKGV